MGLEALPQWRDATFQIPDCAGSREGPCLVVGGGHTVWSDLASCGGLLKTADVLCINDIAMHYPGAVQHMYSGHANQLGTWAQARKFRHCHRQVKEDSPPLLHSCGQTGGVITWPLPGHGTSSLCAIYVALGLGYDDIRACGVPLDDGGYYFSPPEALRDVWVQERWSNFTREVPDRDYGLRNWTQAAEEVFDGRVTVVSGRAAGRFGGRRAA